MKPSQQATAEGALFTDFYQLTMAQLYYREGLHERPSQFEYFFRSYPNYGAHQVGYCLSAGLAWLMDYLERYHFREEDLDYLRSTVDVQGKRLFAEEFLRYLKAHANFSGLTIHAVPEGRVVHAGAPLAVVEGPLMMAQLLETALLNRLNYPTLIATKASRVKQSAQGGVVIDYGMRRGQERGVNAGTRAALIGGVDYSSNTGLSYTLGLPPKGTHAHSLVQSFMALGLGELAAFRAYAALYPDDCLLLVDTVDTLQSGVPNAVTVFRELRQKGHQPLGVRLDSGDLAYLSIQTARQLDEAGFEQARIVLSGNLEEFTIWQITTQIESDAAAHGVDPKALLRRLSYGVGTQLMVSNGAAALDGVYKLVAIYDQAAWRPAIKLSETPSKTLNPGKKALWRLYDRRGKATADLVSLADEDLNSQEQFTLRHPTEAGVYRSLEPSEVSGLEPLLERVFAGGHRVTEEAGIPELRQRAEADLARLDAGVKRLINPHIYHVSLSEKLWELKQQLITQARSLDQ